MSTSMVATGRGPETKDLRPETRRWLVWLGLAVLLAFALRLYRIDHHSVWWDESYSVELAEKSLWEGTLQTAGDIHPPLHYNLLHFWIRAGGRSEYSIRFHSLTFGLLLVPLTYQLGRRLAGRGPGLAAAAIIGASPFHVAYSQEARMFSLETLLATLSVYFMVRLLQSPVASHQSPVGTPQDSGLRTRDSKPETRWLWFGWVLSTALSLYADYFPVFVILFQNVFLALVVLVSWMRGRETIMLRASAGGDKPPPYGPAMPSARAPGVGSLSLVLPRASLPPLLRWWIGGQALAFLLYLPWFLVAFFQVTGYGYGRITTPSIPVLLAQTWSAYNLGQSSYWNTVWAFWGFNTFLVVAALVLGWRWRGGALAGATTFLGLYMVVPLLVFVVTLQFRPFFNPRYMLVATPPLYLLLGLLLWRLGAGCPLPHGHGSVRGLLARWRLLVAAATAVALGCGFAWSLNNYFFNPTYAKDDARSVMAFLRREATDQDLILWQTPHPFYYYYQGTTPAVLHRTQTATSAAELTARAQGRQRVFWVTWEHNDTDPWDLVNFLLRKGSSFEGTRDFTGYRVTWYRLPPEPAFSVGDLRPVEVNFADRLAFTGVAFGGYGDEKSVTAGEHLWASLAFRSVAPIQEELKFFLHLRDRQGRVVAQTDRLLWSDGWVRTNYWRVDERALGVATVRVPLGTPPGSYDLEVGLYAEGQGVPLGIKGGSAPLLVGSLTVDRPAMGGDPSQLPIPYRTTGEAARFSPLRLLGYAMGADGGEGPPLLAAAAGERLPLTLFWQAERTPERDYHPFLDILAGDGRRGAVLPAEPVDGAYPTGRWLAGELVTDRRDLQVAPDLPPGDYRLHLRVEETGSMLLARLQVRETARTFVVPAFRHGVGARLGNAVELLGYDAAGEIDARDAVAGVAPGGVLDLVLHWQATGTPERNYTVFTHLIDAQERIWGQKDSPPQEGASPTGGWIAGQVISDRYRIPVQADTTPGDYRIEVGMYDPVNGVRLPAAGGGDRLLLGTVRVGK